MDIIIQYIDLLRCHLRMHKVLDPYKVWLNQSTNISYPKTYF